MMATLRIQRNNEFINKARNYCIYVDGQKAGTIANGETKDFIVTSGQHQVVAKIDWCSSPTIFVNATDADTCAYKIGTFKYANIIFPIWVIICLVSTLLQKWINFDFVFYFTIPVFLYYIYHLTLGRKKYLRFI